MYYAVSTFGSQVSAIGMATSTSLSNPVWTDHGSAVLQSHVGSAFNAIDPSILKDNNGNMWMTFGSFWQGIYEVQLNPTTGLLLNPSSPTYIQLAKNPADPNDAIEASYLYHRGGYYYLFANWDNLNNTYNIRVGRSTSVNGPFLDQSGVNMVSGGGTLLLQPKATISPRAKSAFILNPIQNITATTTSMGRTTTSLHTASTKCSGQTTLAIVLGYRFDLVRRSTSSGMWSYGVNWGGNAPATGTDLKFGALVAGGFTTCQNDNHSAAVRRVLRFQSNAAAYTLTGASIRLAGPIVNSSANNQVVNLNVFSDTGSGSIDTGAKKITIGGILSEIGGSKSLTKIGSGNWFCRRMTPTPARPTSIKAC